MQHLKDQKGAGLTEYSLTLALIALVAIVSINAVGYAIAGEFEKIACAGVRGAEAVDGDMCDTDPAAPTGNL